MDTYKFYYDESEHSRKINYNTVTAPNYYDNFVTLSEKKKVARDYLINDKKLTANEITKVNVSFDGN